MNYLGKLKYVQSGTQWLQNSYGLKACPYAILAYQKKPDVRFYEVQVNDLFSDMDIHNPGFGKALFQTAITEDLCYLKKWVTGIRTSKGCSDFAAWLEALFSDYESDADMHKLLPQKLSTLYNTIQDTIVERLRGYPIYVIGYVDGNLLIASKSDIPESLTKSLLGG